MIEVLKDATFEEFLEWYSHLNPDDILDKHEAANIFFNLEDYEILGV
jgi:hypothetical protein